MMWSLPMRPTPIASEEQLIALLRGRRVELGQTQADLDFCIGWSDGYSAKVEAPDRSYGRRAAWGIADSLKDWLQGLGLKLVLMDAVQADALAAASEEPPAAESSHSPYPGRLRDRPPVRRTIVRTAMIFTHAA
jgi:hypothetical protein